MEWYSIHHKMGIAHVSIFGELGGFGIPAENLIADLYDAQKVELRVDSPGGVADCGLKLYHAFTKLDVSVVITGHCKSAALVAVLGAKKIVCYSTAELLIHPSYISVIGGANLLRSTANLLAGIDAECNKLTVMRTGQPLEVVRHWSSKETMFTAEEALAAGLVDEVITAPDVHQMEGYTGLVEPLEEACSEKERIFLAWLKAFGRVPVNDKGKFARRVFEWIQLNAIPSE